MFYVYLLASRKQGTLYVGVTRELVRRSYEHKARSVPGFTSRYGDRLVWFECCDDPVSVVGREKGIKKWRRAWKVALTNQTGAICIRTLPGSWDYRLDSGFAPSAAPE